MMVKSMMKSIYISRESEEDEFYNVHNNNSRDIYNDYDILPCNINKCIAIKINHYDGDDNCDDNLFNSIHGWLFHIYDYCIDIPFAVC